MNKDMLKNIIIGILSVIIIVLVICLISIKETVKYTYFDDNLIDIDNETDLDVKANILYDNTLAILLTSKEDEVSLVQVNVKAYNGEGKELFKDSFEQLIFEKNGSFFTFNLPNIGKYEYAGDIKVTVHQKQIDYDSEVTAGKIDYTIEKNENDDNSLSVDVDFKNNNADLSYLSGAILAFKNNDIVGFQMFAKEDIKNGGTANEKAQFASETGKKFEYDKIDVYVYGLEKVSE